MSAKKGIEKYGMLTIQAVLQDFTQFDAKRVVAPIDPDTLSLVERKRSLCAINLLQEKRNGRLKARACADCCSQRPYISKEEPSLPTVSTEALTITLAIDTHEKKDVTTCDIVGA